MSFIASERTGLIVATALMAAVAAPSPSTAVPSSRATPPAAFDEPVGAEQLGPAPVECTPQARITATLEPEAREPLVTTIKATIAAASTIISAVFAIDNWLTDNFTRAVVAQDCFPPDGDPDEGWWATEDSGWDWAYSALTLSSLAPDPCGWAWVKAYADDVWGEETENDVWIRSSCGAEPSSDPQELNRVCLWGRAKADDYEVIVSEPPPRAPSQERETVLLVRTVEIDSLVMASTRPFTANDTARTAWTVNFVHDGVPAGGFSAGIEWTDAGLSVTGDLTWDDIDTYGYSPGDGWVVKVLDF